MTSTVNTAITTVETLTKTVKSASSGGLNVDAVVDGHMAFGLSGSYPVYVADDVRVSIGTNLKIFVLPFNMPLAALSPTLKTNASLLGQIKLNKLEGVDTLTKSVETSVNGIKPIINDLNGIKADLVKIKTQIDNSGGNVAALLANPQALTEITTTANSLQNKVPTTMNNASKAFNDFSKIQSDFTKGAGEIAMKGTILNPSSVGFGLDLGVDAVLLNQSLWVGLLLQNPVVLWPATERPFSVGVTGQFNVDDTKATPSNYNASEPFAALVAARYSFDQILPSFPGLSVMGSFEFVANNRTPALTLAAQKHFGAIPLYVGLGTRLGGITTIIFGQLGLQTAGPFGLELSVGVSPTLSGGAANLGMYLQF